MKQHMGTTAKKTELPVLDEYGLIPKEPIAIVDRRMVKKNNIAVTEVLVQWKNSFPEVAT